MGLAERDFSLKGPEKLTVRKESALPDISNTPGKNETKPTSKPRPSETSFHNYFPAPVDYVFLLADNVLPSELLQKLAKIFM